MSVARPVLRRCPQPSPLPVSVVISGCEVQFFNYLFKKTFSWSTTDLQCCVSLRCSARVRLYMRTCPILCDLMDYGPPGSAVRGILQAGRLEWAAVPSSRGSSRPRDRTESPVSPTSAGRLFTSSAIWEAHKHIYLLFFCRFSSHITYYRIRNRVCL